MESTSSSSSVTPQPVHQIPKGRALLNKLLPDSSTLSSFRDNYAYFARCASVGMFYGCLLGAGTPVSPIFYKTFQKDAGAQFSIIFTFTTVGFVCSSVPYGLFLDNAPSKQRIVNDYLKTSPSYSSMVKTKPKKEQLEEINKDVSNIDNDNNEQQLDQQLRNVDFVFNEKSITKASRTWAPQFSSFYQPVALGLSCWLGGHLYYPGRFVLQFEDKSVRMREFLRMTAKTALALHRVHIPFVIGWSLFFGVMVKPLRKSHSPEYYYAEQMKDVVWGKAEMESTSSSK